MITRFSENTTSFEVTGVPSENFALWRSWNVNVFAFFEAVYDVARSGTGLVLEPCSVNRVS